MNVASPKLRGVWRVLTRAYVGAMAAAAATPLFVFLFALSTWGPRGKLLWPFVVGAVVAGSVVSSYLATATGNIVFGARFDWLRVAAGIGLGLACLVALTRFGDRGVEAFLSRHLVAVAAATCAVGAVAGTFSRSRGKEDQA